MTPFTWFRAGFDGLPRGLVVVDATPAAAGLWFGPVLSVLEEFAERIPPHRHPDVGFLGGRRPHALASVLRGLGSDRVAGPGPAVDVRAGLGRYPVLGPALWPPTAGPIVLITNCPVLDLADWATPDVTGRVLVYRLTGRDRVTPPGFIELDPDADLGRFVDHLLDPVVSARVGGGDTFALDWDDDRYRWENGALVAENPPDGPLLARFAVPGGPPAAAARLTSGVELRLTVSPAPPPPDPPAVPLAPSEGDVLRQWQRGSGYFCKHCGRLHTPGRARCDAADADAPLFPTLAKVPAAPIYVAEQAAGQWAVRPVLRGLLPLPDGRVLARRDGISRLYSHTGDRWEASDESTGQFVPLGDAGLAILG